jgi:hypothetical protein
MTIKIDTFLTEVRCRASSPRLRAIRSGWQHSKGSSAGSAPSPVG